MKLFRRFLEKLYLRDDRPWRRRSPGRPFPQQGHSTVSFCAWDGQELLAKIAGSFAVVPFNILSADIYTRGDNVVLDIFRVCDPKFRAVTDKRDIALVEATLRSALTDERFDFAAAARAGAAARSSSGPAAARWIFRLGSSVENKAHPHLHPCANSNAGPAGVALRIALRFRGGTRLDRALAHQHRERRGDRHLLRRRSRRRAGRSPIRRGSLRCKSDCSRAALGTA